MSPVTTRASIIEVAPARTTDGHPTMALGQAFLAAVGSVSPAS
jgi:hypothetical protein